MMVREMTAETTEETTKADISEFTQFKKDDLKVNNRNNKCKY